MFVVNGRFLLLKVSTQSQKEKKKKKTKWETRTSFQPFLLPFPLIATEVSFLGRLKRLEKKGGSEGRREKLRLKFELGLEIEQALLLFVVVPKREEQREFRAKREGRRRQRLGQKGGLQLNLQLLALELELVFWML
jgi:hypothetical protein